MMYVDAPRPTTGLQLVVEKVHAMCTGSREMRLPRRSRAYTRRAWTFRGGQFPADGGDHADRRGGGGSCAGGAGQALGGAGGADGDGVVACRLSGPRTQSPACRGTRRRQLP